MRKQESVHLHALLVAVADHFDEQSDVPTPELAPYRHLEVSPSGIHHSKDAHEEALLVLARQIEDGLTRQAPAGPGPR